MRLIVGPLLGLVCAPVVHAQTLTVDQLSFQFFAQYGGQPVSRSLSIGGPGVGVGFSIRSTATWLSVNPASGIVPRVVMVEADPGGMPPGKYAATLSVSSNSGSVLNIQVSFTVTNDPVLQTGIASLSFPYQLGHTLPATQDVTVTSNTGAMLHYAATAATAACGNSWLTLSGAVTGNTDGVLTVSANPSAMAVGVCSGSVTISATDAFTGAPAAGSPVVIPVNLYVQDSPLLLVLPPMRVTFATPAGVRLQSGRSFMMVGTTSNALLSYIVQCSTAGGGDAWLTFGLLNAPGAGNHYGAVGVDSGSLPAGAYSGVCGVYGYTQDGAMVANSPVTIPITLLVTAGTLILDPPSLVFTAEPDGIPPENIAVNGDPGVSYNADGTVTGQVNWLSVSPPSGATPGSIRVAAQASGLAAGSYQGAIRVAAHGAGWAPVAGSPAVVNVTLAVPPAIAAIPASLSFLQQQGGTPPQAQSVSISSMPISTGYTVTAATEDGALWLSAAPASGGNPAAIQVSASGDGLAAGVYAGTVTVRSPGVPALATVSVHLTIVPAPLPILFGVLNAGSFVGAAVSPGENTMIFGAGLGPPDLVRAQLTTSGLPTTLGDTRVLFGDTLAPIYSASGPNLGVMVPYEIAGQSTVTIRVAYRGVLSDPVTYPVVPAIPGIYTTNNSGSGQGLIVNQDGVTLNSQSSPAPEGSIVSMYITGEGQTAPAGATGAIAPVDGSNRNTPVLPVTATVGGLPADVEYCGSAPGLVYGVAQVNVRIPLAAPSGVQPIVIQVGGSRTQAGVTVVVR